MTALPTGLTRDQFAAAVFQLDPSYTYRFLDDGGYTWTSGTAYPGDAAVISAWTIYDTNQQNAAAAEVAARNVDSPITALEAARTAIANVRTALQTSVPALNSEDNTIQALTSPTLAQLTTRVKALSARNRSVVGDLVAGEQALLDGETAIRDALVALKNRTGT